MTHEIKFDFDEVPLAGVGLLAYGHAILTSIEDDDSEFYVSRIVLDGNSRGLQQRGHTSIDPFEEKLFSLISDQIQNNKSTIGKAAALEWAGAVTDRLPVPVNERARLQAHFGTLDHRTQGLVAGAKL